MGLLKSAQVKAGWVLGRLLPVRRSRIVFSNFYGRGFGDNLRPIAEVLRQRDPGLELIWLTDGETARKSLPEGVRACPYYSFRRGIALGTAKIWVDNCRKGAPFKKPGQKYLQTWHGFALKRIEKDAESKLPEGYATYAMRDAQQTDLMVSDSSFMTEKYRSAFWYDGPIEEYGAPRNDMLIRGGPEVREKVQRVLGLPAGQKTVLYAPTFRADRAADPYSVDLRRLKAACETRFGGEYSVLVRLHPIAADLAEAVVGTGEAMNVTDYPDTQELLAAADVLVTDYSSVMFDFMLTGRPCFQYASDIAAYRNDRDFYFALDQLPFPLAEDNDHLEQEVLGFSQEEYQERLQLFIREMGIVTDGRGAERCADWILEHIERAARPE